LFNRLAAWLTGLKGAARLPLNAAVEGWWRQAFGVGAMMMNMRAVA